RSLREVDYPLPLFRVLVVADNCSDATARRAEEAGATVLVRDAPGLRGKGYALEVAFARSLSDGAADAAVVVDADTVASPNLLEAFAARLERGARAIQARYGVRNPQASWRTRLMAVALAAFHDVRSRARERLGLSCGLRGNGMCFSSELLRAIPHAAHSLVEDVEYGIALAESGVRVQYADEAHVLGEMVTAARRAASQRRRWEIGRREMSRAHAPRLLRQALQNGDRVRADLALDLLVPPFSQLVAAAGAGLLVGAGLRSLGAPGLTLGIAVACWLMLAACVARAWALSGTGASGLLALCGAPGYALWKIAVVLRARWERPRDWVRTARETPRAGESARG